MDRTADHPSARDDGDGREGGGSTSPAVVVREVTLGCDGARAWDLVATAEGLARWLGTDVHLEPAVGGALVLRDERGAVRRGRVVTVDEGRSLTFDWTGGDDDATRSTVALTVDPVGDGTSVVTVEERAGGGRIAACADAGAAWDDRLLALELDVVAGPLGRALVPAL